MTSARAGASGKPASAPPDGPLSRLRGYENLPKAERRSIRCGSGFRLRPAALGGPITGVRDGDIIRFDVKKQLLEVELDASVLRQRVAEWKAPQPRYTTGVFGKYAALVWSASQGAITKPR